MKSEKRIVVVDTETSDMDPAEGAALLEIACVVVAPKTSTTWRVLDGWSSLVVHTGPIAAQARAVHHISPEMVKVGSEHNPITRSNVMLEIVDTINTDTVWAAHYMEFDEKFLPELTGQPKICTYRCARHVWSGAPAFGNQVLRYWHGLKIDFPDSAGTSAHRAMYDAWTTAHVLMRLLEERSVDELIRLTTQPFILHKCTLKKHKDQLWENIPSDYMRWILRQDFDADTVYTCEYWLKKRGL